MIKQITRNKKLKFPNKAVVAKLRGLPDLMQWTAEKRNLMDLIPYARNPRTITPERLAKLKERILSQGYRNPITIDEKNTILAGHQRLKVLKELINAGEGDIEVTVMVPPKELIPLSAALRKEIVASDNISWGADDWDILQEDYTKDMLKDYGFQLSKWTEKTINFKAEDDKFKDRVVTVCAKNKKDQEKIFHELEKLGYKLKPLKN